MNRESTLGRAARLEATPITGPRSAQDFEPAGTPSIPISDTRAQTLGRPAIPPAHPRGVTRVAQALEPAICLPKPIAGSRAQTLPPAEREAIPKETSQADLSPFAVLRVWAEMFEDAQRARIATENRALRAGLDPESYAPQLATLATAEHAIGLAMRRTYRAVCPLAIRDWQQEQLGIGEHLLARLLGVIGHPRHTTVYHWEGTGTDRVLVEDGPMERRVSDLWSYCGHGDAERKRRAGMSVDDAFALGSPRAKMLTRLLAESCMKILRSPYRATYDARRAVTAERSDWTPLHRHNDALRITGKAILRDLWIAAEDGGR